MTKQHDTTPTPTEPSNPAPPSPAHPKDVPAPVPPPAISPPPASIGEDDGTTNAQPHCTPEQIANGTCVRG